MNTVIALQHSMPAIDSLLRQTGYVVVRAENGSKREISAYLYTGHRPDLAGYHFGVLPVDRQIGWLLPGPLAPWPFAINVSGLNPDEVLFILKYRLALAKH